MGTQDRKRYTIEQTMMLLRAASVTRNCSAMNCANRPANTGWLRKNKGRQK